MCCLPSCVFRTCAGSGKVMDTAFAPAWPPTKLPKYIRNHILQLLTLLLPLHETQRRVQFGDFYFGQLLSETAKFTFCAKFRVCSNRLCPFLAL
jgi:hypothetical protein